MEEKKWYILQHLQSQAASEKYKADVVIERFNRTEGCDLELFAPTMTRMTNREGKFVKYTVPLTFHYVFVRGTADDVKKLCRGGRFAFLLNRGSEERYATLTDSQMDKFRLMAMAYGNNLPFFSLEDIDLEEGDLVEIVEGAFPGLVGRYMPKTKGRTGDIVLAVAQNLGTMVYDVPAKYVRVLEFSTKSRRSYDQIDAFVPRVFKALRYYSDRQLLPDKDKVDLAIFCRRMHSVKVDNPKVAAKLYALLACANTILGDTEAAAECRQRLEARMGKVTAPAMLALISLLQAVVKRDRSTYEAGLAQLDADTSSGSKSRRALEEEYAHYRTLFEA